MMKQNTASAGVPRSSEIIDALDRLHVAVDKMEKTSLMAFDVFSPVLDAREEAVPSEQNVEREYYSALANQIVAASRTAENSTKNLEMLIRRCAL